MDKNNHVIYQTPERELAIRLDGDKFQLVRTDRKVSGSCLVVTEDLSGVTLLSIALEIIKLCKEQNLDWNDFKKAAVRTGMEKWID